MKSKATKPLITKALSALLLLFSLQTFSASDTAGYEIKIVMKKLGEGKKIELCYYYGEKQYIKDSAKVNSKGEAIFKGKEKLPQGVYLIVPPNRTYYDFLVEETQHFTLETDTSDYINKMKVKGSAENELFFNYQKFMVKKQKEAEPIRDKYKTISKNNKDSTKLLQDQLNKLGEEVKTYQKDLMTNNPKSFVTKFLKAMEEPVIPENPPLLPNGKKDSTFAYRYFKAHYFDNFDLSDDRMLRTPIFQNFIKRYIDKLTVPLPDSISASCDDLVARTKSNKEMFKYMVWYLTYTYETSKYMGMDAVFVHLVENYYTKGQAYWLDSAQQAKIWNAAMAAKPLLIGKQAPSLNLKDSTGKYISLYDLKSKYTVVVFWDHGCGHCKKAIPILSNLYDSILHNRGVEVYAVETENNPTEWKKFIQDHHLKWINVHETDEYYLAFAKRNYNVTSTPLIYVFDENKVIKAKKVDSEQIANIIDMIDKEKEAKEKEKTKEQK
jgi:peroxiredoxin